MPRMIGWLWCRRGLAGLSALGWLLGSTSAEARQPPPRDIGCPTSCRLLLEPGGYRLTVEPSRSRRGGQRRIEVVDTAVYQIDAAPRGRRALGLTIASLGIPLALGGFGAMLGSADVDADVPSRRRTWFWSGALAFGAGATLVPIGLRLYGARPDVVPEPLPLYPSLPAASPDTSITASMPLKPHRDAVPAGYTLVEEPRWGLVTTGALTLAGSYGLFVAASAAMLASDTWDDENGAIPYMFVPVVGPAIYDARHSNREERGLLTFWGSMPQVTGLVLLIVGASTSHSWLVPEGRAELVPWFSPHAGGLALQGELF